MEESTREAVVDRWNSLDIEGSIYFKELREKGVTAVEMRVPDWPDWMVSGLFAIYEGRLALVELRIFPAEDRAPRELFTGASPTEAAVRSIRYRGGIGPDTEPDPSKWKFPRDRPKVGEWSRDPSRLGELAIGDGLPATMLKDIRTGPLFDFVQSFVGYFAASVPEAPEVYEQMIARPNPGRHRRDDLHWAEWARRIDEKTASVSRSPITDIANDLGLNGEKGRGKVRDIAHECRAHGFLGPPIPGRGGGYMTDKARQVLKAAQQSKKSAKRKKGRQQ